MQTDEAALTRWVKAAGAEEEADREEGAPVHPQLRVEKQAAELEELWNPQDVDSRFAEVDQFLNWVPEGGFACTTVNITAGALRRANRKGMGKAAGPDDWRADEWDKLPEDFWLKLAEVWELVLGGAPIPEQWLHVRCVMIPKEGGGQRPISVAELAWRTWYDSHRQGATTLA